MTNMYLRLKYFKEVELRATREEDTFQMVAEYCFHWSMRQGWFQFSPEDKLPGGKKIQNRNGTNSLKPKSPNSLFYEAFLKPYDEKRYITVKY